MDAKNTEITDMAERDDRVRTAGGEAPDADRAADDAHPAGAGATETDDAARRREDELHDEALEETFPASDPPSAKHIT